MALIILIGLAIIFYTLFDVFASRAGNKIDANLSSVIFNGIGALIPLAVYFWLKTKNTTLIATNKSGLLYSLMAGISIAVFSILLIKIFEKGGLSYVVPLIYGGSLALAAFIGWTIYREPFSLLQLAGVLVILLGIVLIIISELNQ